MVREGSVRTGVHGWITFDGGWSRLLSGEVEDQGDVVVVHLGDRPIRTVHLDLGPSHDGEQIVEVWAYRSSGRGAAAVYD